MGLRRCAVYHIPEHGDTGSSGRRFRVSQWTTTLALACSTAHPGHPVYAIVHSIPLSSPESGMSQPKRFDFVIQTCLMRVRRSIGGVTTVVHVAWLERARPEHASVLVRSDL